MEASSSSTNNSSPIQSCSVCPDKFLSNDKLVLHYVINHKYHICEVCTVVTSSYDDMKSHEISTHLPMKCEICCYQITELSELTTHRETSHQLLTCPFCPLTLNSIFELNYHLKRKHFVLVEPLDLGRGLFQDFAMGKWGYLCLLCGKNRETSGFIGHYRGFHRIRVPTLAKILLQANITLSIIGTLGPEEDIKDNHEVTSLHDTRDDMIRINSTGETGDAKVFQQESSVKCQRADQSVEGLANQNARNQKDSNHATNLLPNQSYHQDVFTGNDQQAIDTEHPSASNCTSDGGQSGSGASSLLYSMLLGSDQLPGGNSTGATPDFSDTKPVLGPIDSKTKRKNTASENQLNTTGGSDNQELNITPPDHKFSSEMEDDSSDEEQGDMTSGYFTATGDQKQETSTLDASLFEDLRFRTRSRP
ncbi:hypothetical protein WDU94_010125, partial [Cyamophila willieti]